MKFDNLMNEHFLDMVVLVLNMHPRSVMEKIQCKYQPKRQVYTDCAMNWSKVSIIVWLILYRRERPCDCRSRMTCCNARKIMRCTCISRICSWWSKKSWIIYTNANEIEFKYKCKQISKNQAICLLYDQIML